MTRLVPRPSASGILRRGLRTSPAVNVILFQASEEKSDPVCVTQSATNRPKADAAVRPSSVSPITDLDGRGLQRSPKLPEAAPVFQPIKRASAISASRRPFSSR